MSEQIYSYVYISEAAEDILPKDFSHVITNARVNYSSKNITGILLYDGQYFLQYLEGNLSDLDAVIREIEVLPLHKNIQVLYQGVSLTHARRFDRWELGYIDCINQTAIIDAFHDLLNRSDLSLTQIDQAITPLLGLSDAL